MKVYNKRFQLKNCRFFQFWLSANTKGIVYLATICVCIFIACKCKNDSRTDNPRSYLGMITTNNHIKTELSSAEKTFRMLEKTARADDIEKYVECLYFVTILKDEGYTNEQAIIMQDSLRTWIAKREMKGIKEWLEFSMIIFRQCDFVIFADRKVDNKTRELLIHTIPRSSLSNFKENTSKYYFIKYEDEWLYNFKCIPVTMGIEKVQSFDVHAMYPILLLRDVNYDSLPEVFKGIAHQKPHSILDKDSCEYYIMKFDTLTGEYYEWQHYLAKSDTEYIGYVHLSKTKGLDVDDYVRLPVWENEEEKFAEFIPSNYNINYAIYLDIDIDGDTDVVLNVGHIYLGDYTYRIENDSLIFLENKSGEYHLWLADAMDNVNVPGKIEAVDIDRDSKLEILCWGYYYGEWMVDAGGIYLNIYRYGEISSNNKK